MNSFLKSVMETETPYNTAVLWWLGQMGLLIKMGKTVVCVDYFASEREDRLIPPPIPADEVEGIDVFVASHNHMDHLDHESWRKWIVQCPEARFIYPDVHRESVRADGIGYINGVGLTEGEVYYWGDVSVTPIAAAHEFLNPDPKTGKFPCLQYIIRGNGVSIYHAGDTLRYEGMVESIDRYGRMDVAMLPINGRDGARYRRNCIGNMTFQEAVDLAGILSPRMVIPGHWDMFADNPGDPDAFADYLDAKYPGKIHCVIPQHLKPIFVTGDM